MLDELGVLLCGLLAVVLDKLGVLLCGLLAVVLDKLGVLLCGLLAGMPDEPSGLSSEEPLFSEKTDDDMYDFSDPYRSGSALQPVIRQQASIKAKVFFINNPFIGISMGRLFKLGEFLYLLHMIHTDVPFSQTT